MIDENLMASSFENFGRNLARCLNSVADVFINIWNDIKPLAEKIIKYHEISNKLTKKKFKKLLQASGIQRNEINKILKNNRDQYTRERLNKMLDRRKFNAN